MAALAGVFSLALIAVPSATAALIFGDNFNAPDATISTPPTRPVARSGLLASAIQIRSALVQHGISNSQLNFLTAGGGPGRIRFQSAADLPTNVWWDFASGVSGTQLLADRVLRIDLDWFRRTIPPTTGSPSTWVFSARAQVNLPSESTSRRQTSAFSLETTAALSILTMARRRPERTLAFPEPFSITLR
jgi:hypothetical protein